MTVLHTVIHRTRAMVAKASGESLELFHNGTVPTRTAREDRTC
jgi:hypothetical protein